MTARGRRGRQPAPPDLRRRRPRLRADAPGRAALASGGAADDRARAARGDPGRRTSSRTPTRTTPTATGSAGGRTSSGRRRPGARCSGASAGRPGSRRSASPVGRAFSGDIGISTPLQPQRLGRLHRGARPPAAARRTAASRRPTTTVLDLVTFYSRNLAVPARRDLDDPQVLRGQARVLRGRAAPPAITPKFVTDRLHGPARAELPADLALHRPPAARHGRGAGRRPARGARHRDANGAPRRSGASG